MRKNFTILPYVSVLLLYLLFCGIARAETNDKKVDGSGSFLNNYALAEDGLEVEGIRDNLSGVTFHPGRKELYGVVNNPPFLVRMNLEGKIKDRKHLGGLGDAEGITYVKDNIFVAADEYSCELVFMEVVIDDDDRMKVSYPRESILVEKKRWNNNGIEGVAYDAEGKRFFAVKEKNPPRLYSIAWEEGEDKPGEVEVIMEFSEETVDLSDVSGCFYDEKTGHLLVLSDENSCLVELTPEGELIGSLEVPAFQPEGVTMGGDRKIYILGEPNKFFGFEKLNTGQVPSKKDKKEQESSE